MEIKRAMVEFGRDWRGTAVFIGLLLFFRGAIADYMVVPSGLTNPTILEGDRILVHKIDLGLRVPMTSTWLTQGDTPKRGDVAVFFSPVEDITLVKRVFGLAGDTVAMIDEKLVINDQAAQYRPVDTACTEDSAKGLG